ncbi:hypothetical protein J2W70_001301 [Pseudomonas koreensis]|uniref:hypothetical protein n=1 Tax=Pseudomonas koreensis TaxID=198620 RepID=UPI002857E8F9|nr:hypothetical protein [Pseudomonas koreensis]MDR7053951.1 hypothetical protein [Pseudomonas koreensis]
MNDQVAIPNHVPSANISKVNADPVAPRIQEVTDSYDKVIENGGRTKSAHLLFKGSATANVQAVIEDKDFPESYPFYIDAKGHFEARLFPQKRGLHEYTVRTLDGQSQKSEKWIVDVDVSDTVSIEELTDTNGTLILDGEHTHSSKLDFIGKGTPDKPVDLMNNGIVLQQLNVDSDGHWSAKVEGLKPGTQNFSARELNGPQTSPWRVQIKEPTPISIQFVMGIPSFQLIDNHQRTTDRSVVLVGTALPGETGWIADYSGDLVRFAANEHGVYYAAITDLEPNKVHTFRLRSDTGRVSTPWVVHVVWSNPR